MMIFLLYINHIKSYFFAELNENNFYIKNLDLDEIYNFLILSFFYFQKKINNIFEFKGIFVFSHLQFNGVRVRTDGSGIVATKKLE